MANSGMDMSVDTGDMSEAIGTLTGFYTEMATPAHIRSVIEVTHKYFSDDFDRSISNIAKVNKDDFHHVYEYSPSGDGYMFVGNSKQKLWAHYLSTGQTTAEATWIWLPAKNANPTYAQRYRSKVGFDAIRDLSREQLNNLIKNSRGEKHVFKWKAPMLENGEMRTVVAKNQRLVMPISRGGKAFVLYPKSVRVTTQQPGRVVGSFTSFWISYWNNVARGKWDMVLGEAIEKDASYRINNAVTRGQRRNRRRSFSMNVAQSDFRFKQGVARGRAAVKQHEKKIESIYKIGRKNVN